MVLVTISRSDNQRLRKLILVIVAMRKLAKTVKVCEIPPDTLVLNREALLNMYGPTLAALACLQDAPIKKPKLPRASSISARTAALHAQASKINKKTGSSKMKL